jgi:hypothetical protein
VIADTGEKPLYHLTKGTSTDLTFQIPARTEEFYADDGTLYYETALPEITKISNSKPAIVDYNNGVITGLAEGTSTVKVTYRYVYSSATIKETASVSIRVVAYSQIGSMIIMDPNLLVDGDITYSLVEASAVARDYATEAEPYTIYIPGGNYTLSDVVHLYSNITIQMTAETVISTTASSGINMFLLGTTGSYMGEDNYNQSDLCAGYGGFQNIAIRGTCEECHTRRSDVHGRRWLPPGGGRCNRRVYRAKLRLYGFLRSQGDRGQLRGTAAGYPVRH